MNKTSESLEEKLARRKKEKNKRNVIWQTRQRQNNTEYAKKQRESKRLSMQRRRAADKVALEQQNMKEGE